MPLLSCVPSRSTWVSASGTHQEGERETCQEVTRNRKLAAVPVVSRREFLKLAGIAGAAVGLGAGLGGLVAACGCSEDDPRRVRRPVPRRGRDDHERRRRRDDDQRVGAGPKAS